MRHLLGHVTSRALNALYGPKRHHRQRLRPSQHVSPQSYARRQRVPSRERVLRLPAHPRPYASVRLG